MFNISLCYCHTDNSLNTRQVLVLEGDTKKGRLYSAAAVKSLQSCPTLCDPIDGSPPGSAIPRILQARALEWVAISLDRYNSSWFCFSGKSRLISTKTHNVYVKTEVAAAEFGGMRPGAKECWNNHNLEH